MCIRDSSEPIPKPSRPIQKGDLVEIPGVSTPAEVVGVGGDGTLQLKAGILKMKAKADEVRLLSLIHIFLYNFLALVFALIRVRKHWWDDITPVSYTHLDVYKRQGSYCSNYSFQSVIWIK